MKTRLDPSSRLTPTQQLPNADARTTPVTTATVTTTVKPDGFREGDARGNELDGAPRSEAPAATKQVFTGAERAELQKKIPCPALAGMFTQGMLPAEKDGTVKIPDLNTALNQLGLSGGVRGILTHGADKVDETKGSFNLFTLNGSNLDHTGSSGIRQNGTHPERFELLKSFSKDGETLTPHDLSEAATRFAKESPGFRGEVTQLAEMAILLETFGSRDEQGRPFFTLDDAKTLWLDGQIPKSWSPPAVPGTVTLPDILKLAAKMKLDQLF